MFEALLTVPKKGLHTSLDLLTLNLRERYPSKLLPCIGSMDAV
jgi:hypothetical protein